MATITAVLVSIIFWEGDDAQQVLNLIDAQGTEAAITYLAQWDFGDETTNAATMLGDTYTSVPAYQGDRIATSGRHTLVYNHHTGTVQLLRTS